MDPVNKFTVKDSGARQQFASGMQRDTQDNKTRYHLIFDGPMLERWAEHLTKGAQKYDEGNWLKAQGDEELRRFRASAVRHFIQWMRGDTDEDHAAAVFFNINGAEYVKGKTPSPTVGERKFTNGRLTWRWNGKSLWCSSKTVKEFPSSCETIEDLKNEYGHDVIKEVTA